MRWNTAWSPTNLPAPTGPELAVGGSSGLVQLWRIDATPRLARLLSGLQAILGKPDVREALLSEGGEITPGTPEEFAAFLKSEVVKWAKVVKQSGITPE